MRFAVVFGFLGAATLAIAARSAGGWGLLAIAELYLGACFLTLAAIYGLRAAGLNVEAALDRPVVSLIARAVLLPYPIIGAVALYISRWFDREGLFNPVAPGLFIGRLPFPNELPQLRPAGIDAVLNLCWEFPRLSGVDRAPLLDGSPPTDGQFERAVQRVSQWRVEGRNVLIHCAQGHGRTATITAAVLIRLGLASDVDEALALIRAARPFAKPSRGQLAALRGYVAGRTPGA